MVREEQFLAKELYNVALNSSNKIVPNYSAVSYDICNVKKKLKRNLKLQRCRILDLIPRRIILHPLNLREKRRKHD